METSILVPLEGVYLYYDFILCDISVTSWVTINKFCLRNLILIWKITKGKIREIEKNWRFFPQFFFHLALLCKNCQGILEIPTEKIREIEKTKDDFFWEFLFILHFWFRWRC